MTDADTEILWLAGNPTRNTGRLANAGGGSNIDGSRGRLDSRDVEGTNKALNRSGSRTTAWNQISSRCGCGMSHDVGETVHSPGRRGGSLRPSAGAQAQNEFAPKILTLDPAWKATTNAFGLQQGLSFQLLRTMGKNDNDLVVAKIRADFEDEHQADAVRGCRSGTGIVSAGQGWGGPGHWSGSPGIGRCRVSEQTGRNV